MIVYHKISSSSLDSVLQKGLRRQSRGKSGDDAMIIKTDYFLDERRSTDMKAKGISRDNNIYAYIGDGEKIVDITNGDIVSFDLFKQQSDEPLLRLQVDPHRCFVSDLTSYDRVKHAMAQGVSGAELEILARAYWHSVQSLSHFQLGTIRRPEVMITYDISPDDIERVPS